MNECYKCKWFGKCSVIDARFCHSWEPVPEQDRHVEKNNNEGEVMNSQKRILMALNMGCPIPSKDNDGHGWPCDMPTYRTRICFLDKDGRVVYGDVSHGLTYEYDDKMRKVNGHPANLYVDLQIEKEEQSPYRSKTVPVVNYYHHPYGHETANGLFYNQKDVLSFVERMSGVKYDTIEFTDVSNDFENSPEVHDLLYKLEVWRRGVWDRHSEAIKMIDDEIKEQENKYDRSMKHE